MIPDYQSLMRPVLDCATKSEVRIGDVVDFDHSGASGQYELVALENGLASFP